MQGLVRNAMKEGALGVGSALIYFPGNFADTAELTALAKAAAPYGGAYISHMRSEGDRLLEGIDELVGIAKAAGIHGEIYHLKAAGRDNWPKMREAIAHIERARAKRHFGQREHVHLHGRRDRPQRVHAAGRAGRRARCVDRAAQGSARPRDADQGNGARRARTGRTSATPRAIRRTSC